MLKKTRIIENSARYLLKGGYKSETPQPFNEALASEICKRLGFIHTTYTIGIYKFVIVSKCPGFINKNIEFIPRHQIESGIRGNKDRDYKNYIN